MLFFRSAWASSSNKYVSFMQWGGGGGWGIKAWKELFVVLPAVYGHPHTPNPQAEKTWQEWQRRFPQEKSCRNKNEKADLQQQHYVQWIRWIHCIPKNTLPLAQRLKSNYITMREHHLQRASRLWVGRNIPLKHLQVFSITWFPTPLLPW